MTLRHFRQFQGMWEYRLLGPMAGGSQAEWWTAFRWFLRNCFSKAKNQIDKSGFTVAKQFSDKVGEGVMPHFAMLEEDDSQESGQRSEGAVDKGKGRTRNSAVATQDEDALPLWPLPPSINLLPVGGHSNYMFRDAP
jgi:hypothetical protein